MVLNTELLDQAVDGAPGRYHQVRDGEVHQVVVDGSSRFRFVYMNQSIKEKGETYKRSLKRCTTRRDQEKGSSKNKS